jgi:hypothetical protein
MIGIITKMSMTVVPKFYVYKSIFRNLSWDELKDDAAYDAFHTSSDFLSAFCNWENREFTSVWQGHKYVVDTEHP